MNHHPAPVSMQPAARAKAATNRQKAIQARHIITRCAVVCILALGILSAGQTVMAQVVEGKFYRIKNVGSNKCLALGDDAKTVEGAQIVQRMKGDSAREQWSFVKQGNVYKIINRENGQALNVQGGSTAEGAPIIQWAANVKGKNQRWTLEAHGAYFALKAKHSGMVVDVADGAKERKALIVQNTFRNTETQLFELLPVE